MRAQLWRDDAVVDHEMRALRINLYFAHELALMLERTGFVDVVVAGDHEDPSAAADDEFVVVIAVHLQKANSDS